MLFDGQCEMCRTGAEVMRRFDNAGAIETLDLHDPQARARFQGLRLEDLLEELHVVDDRGRVFRGARALNQILRCQRGLRRLLAYLWYLPGYPLLADWQYKRLAATRYHRGAGGRRKQPQRL